MSLASIGIGALAGGISGYKRDDRTVLGSTLAGGLVGMGTVGRGMSASRVGSLLGGAYGLVGNMGIITASGLGSFAGMGVTGARMAGKTFMDVRRKYPKTGLFGQVKQTGRTMYNDYNNWVTGMVNQYRTSIENTVGRFGNKSVSAYNPIQTTLKGGR